MFHKRKKKKKIWVQMFCNGAIAFPNPSPLYSKFRAPPGPEFKLIIIIICSSLSSYCPISKMGYMLFSTGGIAKKGFRFLSSYLTECYYVDSRLMTSLLIGWTDITDILTTNCHRQKLIPWSTHCILDSKS